MNVPKQIVRFASTVHIETENLTKLVGRYNELAKKKDEISKIAKEYINVKLLDNEHARELLINGIDIELSKLSDAINKKIDRIYLDISCEKPDGVDVEILKQ